MRSDYSRPGQNKEFEDLLKKYHKQFLLIRQEMSRVIVGQEEIINSLIEALLCNGHVLVEGVPGIAKTMTVRTLSTITGGQFSRIQFTPDLLPTDIIGITTYEEGRGFYSVKGPIFANFVLADEINRAPPKVQSALLEAMQEKQVSIHGETFEIKKPFMVLATQNPIESEGTYKLPEAQIDRFMFKILIGYPSKKDEIEIMNRFTEDISVKASKIITTAQIADLQKFNKKIYADDKIKEYVADIVECSRYPEKYKLDIKGHIDYGASPRASLWLILAAKANAMLNGRGYVKPEDVKAIANDVLRHRIILSYEAEAEGIIPDQIIDSILNKIKVP